MALPLSRWLIRSLGVVFVDATDIHTYDLKLKHSVAVFEEI